MTSKSPELLLTDFTQLKGCSCKIPQAKLLALLKAGGFDNSTTNQLPHEIAACSRPGSGDDVGMDCSIEELSFRDSGSGEKLYLISSTDFFFPSVENATDQGAIGAANVVSDLCAMGISKPDTVLMLLAASVEMDEEDRTEVTIEMIRGFNNAVIACGSRVTGGQSVYNPWPLIGGTAIAVLPESRFIRPTNLRIGDVLVLTKPIGTQLGVNLRHWSKRPTRLYEEFIKGKMTQEEIDQLYHLAVCCMRRLNTNGAKMMMKYKSSGATDVTGFGLMGHAKNLSIAQETKMKIIIDTLPILAGAEKADKLMNGHYKLTKGFSAETSGGLLFAVSSREVAEQVVQELISEYKEHAWIVGRVEARTGEDDLVSAIIAPDCKTIEVISL
jgi:selenide, water dikinase